MEVNFEAVIKSEEFEVEMTPSLETFMGISEITKHTAEAVIFEENKKRLSRTSNARTLLKKNMRGSHRQLYSLVINDEDAQKRLRRMTTKTFIEILSYVISEATYQKTDAISPKALAKIKSLGLKIPKLIEKIKHSPIINAHSYTKSTGTSVEIIPKTQIKHAIAKFNIETLENIKAEPNEEIIKFTATIHRFNNKTGNGRLTPIDSDETFAFGFALPYKEVPIKMKKRFSRNLDENTGLALDDQEPINITAKSIRRKDGVIVKYLVISYEK